MKYQFVYLNVVAVCLNELDSVCLNGWRAKENLPGGSLKYLFVYVKIRIFKCSYRGAYIYIYMYREREISGLFSPSFWEVVDCRA